MPNYQISMAQTDADGCAIIKAIMSQRPTEAWDFFDAKDKNKLVKAGFATPAPEVPKAGTRTTWLGPPGRYTVRTIRQR